MKLIATLTTITTMVVTQLAFASDKLPLSLLHANHHFELCDNYTLRYGFIIKVAEIGWYAPSCTMDKPILQAPTKILRFYYFKDVSADFFKKSAEAYFLMNLNNKEEQLKLTASLKQFNDGYTDIKSGDYFDLMHIKNSHLSLFKNNKLLISSSNPILANKYFNIWFGNKPVIEKLKHAFEKRSN